MERTEVSLFYTFPMSVCQYFVITTSPCQPVTPAKAGVQSVLDRVGPRAGFRRTPE